MTIQLDEPQLKSLLSESILTWLGQDKRDLLMKGAIESLLVTESTYGGGRQSLLERAFKDAAARVATDIATSLLTNDPDFQAKIKDMIVAAVDKLTVEKRDETVQKIADTIVRGLCGDRY